MFKQKPIPYQKGILQKSYPPGTVIECSDRKYVVSSSGAWQVLEYKK